MALRGERGCIEVMFSALSSLSAYPGRGTDFIDSVPVMSHAFVKWEENTKHAA